MKIKQTIIFIIFAVLIYGVSMAQTLCVGQTEEEMENQSYCRPNTCFKSSNESTSQYTCEPITSNPIEPVVINEDKKVKPSPLSRDIPPIKSLNSQNNNEIIFNVPLTFYNPKLGNFFEACQFDLNVNGKSFDKYRLTSPYEFQISVARSQLEDIHLEWDNKVTVGSSLLTQFVTKIPICVVKGDIYLSEIYASEWLQYEKNYNEFQFNSASCLQYGMEFKKLPYYLSKMEGVTNYPSVHHPIASEVLSKCKEIVTKNILRKDYACTVGSENRKTKCDDDWYEKRSDNHDQKLNGFKELIESSLSGKTLIVIGYESEESYLSNKARIAQQEADRNKNLEDQEKYQKWLSTPEGKKSIAEESARIKKAKEDQAVKENQDRVNLAKEFPYYALLTCTINALHTSIHGCFGGDVSTEIELKNGSQYGLYKNYQFSNLGRESRDGFLINLRSSFQLKAQNSNKNLVLGVKIINRLSNNIIFEKQVSRFGVINVRN